MIVIKITLKINYYCFRTGEIEIIEIEKNMFPTFILFYFERVYRILLKKNSREEHKSRENKRKCGKMYH